MTTANIIATLRQGVPVTSRLVREIVVKLERLDWAERSFSAALENYGRERGDVRLSSEESGWVCADLDAHAELRAAVAWMLECEALPYPPVSYATDATIRRGMDANGSMAETRAAARAEVARILGQEAA